MSERRTGSIVWPIILILAGALLLLDQLGVIDVSVAALLRLWPLILVLVGLELLLRGQRVSGVVTAVLVLVVVAVGAAIVWPALTAGNALETRDYTFPAAGIDSAVILLDIGVGDVQVYALEGGEADLIEATVRYARDRMEVRTDDRVSDGVATIEIASESRGVWFPFGEDSTEWRIGLSPDVPARLAVNAGVGTAHVDLTGMDIAGMDLDGGVGRFEIVLPASGEFPVNIEGGVGTISVTVPTGLEARARIDEGLGSVDVSSRFRRNGRIYTTPGYDDAVARADIDIDGGIGTIVIR